MIAVAHTFPLEAEAPVPSGEHRVLLRDVPWSTYVVLRDSVDSPALRMTYLKGMLEIMRPSSKHEIDKKMIARFVERFCLERDIPLFAYGSTTFRKEENARGLEPDECYSRGADRLPPGVALEVIVSHGLVDKLVVYAGLGIREVWLFENGAFTIVTLRGDHYERIAASDVFPELPLERVAHYATWADQHAALRAFRDELRAAR
jgi:Uma2 family endonuclease